MDELTGVQFLAARECAPSASSKMIVEWKVDRGRMGKIIQHLARDRKLQTTFTSLAGAARFKAANEGKLRHTFCPECQPVDSWSHCMKRYGLELNSALGDKQWLLCIEKLVKDMTTESPATYKAAEPGHESSVGRRGDHVVHEASDLLEWQETDHQELEGK